MVEERKESGLLLPRDEVFAEDDFEVIHQEEATANDFLAKLDENELE